MPLTPDTLVVAGCSRPLAEQHYPHLVNAMLAHGITTPQRGRHFVAQALHECGCLKWMEEIWGPNQWQLRYDSILGNVRAGDGFRYRGRGPFMLTGRGNYREYGAMIGRPYEDDPDLVARPADGWLVAARYWKSRNLNAAADRGDARAVTKGINGKATDDAPSHHRQRMAIFARLPADCEPVAPDPYKVLTREERAVVEALDAKLRIAQRNGGWDQVDASHLTTALRLREQLVELRKAIWRAANAEPDGWDVKRRRQRYALLKAKTR